MMIRRRTYGRSKPDPNTKLLMHFDGSIIDATGNNTIVVAVNNFVTGKFGNALFINSNYVEVNTSNINFSGDWTIEFFYKDYNTASNIWSCGMITNAGSSGIAIRPIPNDGFTRFYFNVSGLNGGSYVDVSNSIVVSKTAFKHIAMSKQGNIGRVFVDGTLRGSKSGLGANSANPGNIIIGRWLRLSDPQTVASLSGYFDELRISDKARYTENFNVPTSPLK